MESELNRGKKDTEARANEGRKANAGPLTLGSQRAERGKRKRERKTKGVRRGWTVGDSREMGA